MKHDLNCGLANSKLSGLLYQQEQGRQLVFSTLVQSS